jgi:hypothetical protein
VTWCAPRALIVAQIEKFDHAHHEWSAAGD